MKILCLVFVGGGCISIVICYDIDVGFFFVKINW